MNLPWNPAYSGGAGAAMNLAGWWSRPQLRAQNDLALSLGGFKANSVGGFFNPTTNAAVGPGDAQSTQKDPTGRPWDRNQRVNLSAPTPSLTPAYVPPPRILPAKLDQRASRYGWGQAPVDPNKPKSADDWPYQGL